MNTEANNQDRRSGTWLEETKMPDAPKTGGGTRAATMDDFKAHMVKESAARKKAAAAKKKADRMARQKASKAANRKLILERRAKNAAAKKKAVARKKKAASVPNSPVLKTMLEAK